MDKVTVALLVGSLVGAIYFYRTSPFISLLCLGGFLFVIMDARSH